MRNIVKGSEPKCLAAHRRNYAPPPDYDNLPGDCKKALKSRMREEQGGLCCYCMSRITADNGHIEHWYPQSKGGSGDKSDLAYANMLLVCGGGSNGGVLHCDALKGDMLLKFNPANPRHNVEARIRYLANGKIECHDDVEFNAQLQKVLNLNTLSLVRARAVLIARMREKIRRQKAAELTRMKKKYSQCRNSDGTLPEFCMTAIYFIDKAIRKAAYRKNAGRN